MVELSKHGTSWTLTPKNSDVRDEQMFLILTATVERETANGGQLAEGSGGTGHVSPTGQCGIVTPNVARPTQLGHGPPSGQTSVYDDVSPYRTLAVRQSYRSALGFDQFSPATVFSCFSPPCLRAKEHGGIR